MKKLWWILWAYLFLQCAVLGFVPTPPVWLQIIFGLIAVGFFVPPFLLLRRGEKKTVVTITAISGASLVLTLVLIICNYASSLITGVEGRTWGQVLNVVLGIVSTPMYCGQAWLLSLFGWAFLLNLGIQSLWKKKKK